MAQRLFCLREFSIGFNCLERSVDSLLSQNLNYAKYESRLFNKGYFNGIQYTVYCIGSVNFFRFMWDSGSQRLLTSLLIPEWIIV